ncbi:MAG: hypothetical protein A3F17_05980 [Gammaproteobacteria bacterium RIFCSPHIGHO2_12_FULL_41_15]|nr:MAG: hypothetical protein A3F17_05980 [Gammaproteobacteria bacterium RIFCSPHIGHO2_12_FULL_41_15]
MSIYRNQTYITWDLGATNCSVAYVKHNVEYDHFELLEQHTHPLTEFITLHDMVDCFEDNLKMRMSDVDGILISAAGQYDGNTVHLATPYPFPMEFARVAKMRDWGQYAVVHDYVPVVCATFIAGRNEQIEYLTLNHNEPVRHGRRVAFGVGTGLGLKDGVLLPDGNFWLGMNEMGHIGLCIPPRAYPDQIKLHNEFVTFLQKKGLIPSGRPLTFESILSGFGFGLIHEFFTDEITTPEEAARQLQNDRKHPTLSLFAWYLGLFAGTVQLSFMPDAGLWITGGVINKHLDLFDMPTFNEGVMSSPAYLTERKQMPLYVLTGDRYATIGGAYYASRQFKKRAYMPRLATNLQVA